MCKAGDDNMAKSKEKADTVLGLQKGNGTQYDRMKHAIVPSSIQKRTRRGKRDKVGEFTIFEPAPTSLKKKKKPKRSKALERHGQDSPSGGLENLIPSLIGVSVLIFSVLAQQGFRGRASVAGIDLGTTNSVICVQAPSKTVGEIDCIEDPDTGSPIIPSVVSFLEPHERKVGPSSKIASMLDPHPSHVVVGQRAKQRIDTHPQHTLYHAKRVLGRAFDDQSVEDLRREVEFAMRENDLGEITFRVDKMEISPMQVGSYVVNHLIQITESFLGHSNVKSAVLAVPAKFDQLQRQKTMEAFKNSGVTVARVLEEPTAAALAYGLHKKEGVEKILVYDFGGGTLDISVLHVSEGYCDVMGSDGDDRLGGADFDAAVANLLVDRHSLVLSNLDTCGLDLEKLVASCPRITDDIPLCSVSSFHTIGEHMKIQISQTGETAHAKCLGLEAPVGRKETLESTCNALSVQSMTITLHDFNQASTPLFERSILPATRLIEDLTLRPDEIDEIVMVGGTTRMPQIRELVRSAFDGAQLNTHIDPDITVAYGAASVND